MSDGIALYLDPEDELTSAIARLRSAEAERVVLVLPPGSRIGTSRINFRLIAAEAAAAGRIVAVVAPDPGARALALAAGLEARATLRADDAGSAAGPASAAVPVVVPPRDREPVPLVGRRRPIVPSRAAAAVLAILVIALAAGGWAAFTFLPTAGIALVPAVEPVGPLQLVVTAQPGVTTPDAATLTIPATRLTYEAAVQKTFTATGVKVTETPARGTVTFSNCGFLFNKDIPAGTRVATATGVGFLTLAKISVPAGCGTADVEVEAQQPGTAGNVDAGAIDRLPASLDPNVIQVTNAAPTSGGTRTETTLVSQEDVDAAVAALQQELAATTAATLDATVAGVPAGTTVFRETARTAAPVPSVDPATLVGREVASFELGLTTSGSVLSVDPRPVADLATARLVAKVPAGWTLVDGSLSVVPGPATVVGDTVSYPVTVRATRVRTVDGPSLLAQVLGLELPRARAVLEAYGAVTIEVWPDWVTTVPTNGRATLTVESPAPSASPAPSGAPGSAAP